MEKKLIDTSDKSLRNPEGNTLELLVGKNNDEIFLLMKEGLSPDWLDLLRDDAVAADKGDIAQMVDQVKTGYLARFTVPFFTLDSENNTARVVRFSKEGVNYYHADYALNGREEGQLVMLHRRPDSSWWSEESAHILELRDIGRAIDWYEHFNAGK